MNIIYSIKKLLKIDRLAILCNKTLLLFLVILFSFQVFIKPAGSQTSEINKLDEEIEAKKKEKEEAENKINELTSQINSISFDASNLKKQKEELNSLASQLDSEVKNLLEISKNLEAKLEEYKSEIKKLEDEIMSNTNLLFKLKFNSINVVLMDSENLEEAVIKSAKNATIVELMKQSIDAYRIKITQVDKDLENNKETREQVEETLKQTLAKVEDLEVQIQNYEAQIAIASVSIASYQSEMNEIDGQIKFMSQEKQRLIEAELARMKQIQQVEQIAIESGQYYFTGRGRDLIEGHGLGMSQWGAYGMANLGWTYDQILKHYYSGVDIADYKEPSQITVTGMSHLYPDQAKARGYLTMDEYLAGMGEVPNNWPAEAIKAQVVAARTYVMGTCGERDSCEICGTASCQVYLGGLGKMTFAEQTRGKVILYQGQPIIAYYSASHRGHSSSLSNVWGSTDRPYIQPVSDDAYAAKGYKSCNPYLSSSVWNCSNDQKIETYNWIWRTNGYSLDQLTDILAKDSRLNVGKLKNITLQKDVSGRVGRITLEGDVGTKSLTGWDFKAIYNSISNGDYIYSTEFTFSQQI